MKWKAEIRFILYIFILFYLYVAIALGADTGADISQWVEEKWDHFAAAGDEDMNMVRRLLERSPENPICWPDNAGIPLIMREGTVYHSSSHSGDLTALRDGKVISTFSLHKCFLKQLQQQQQFQQQQLQQQQLQQHSVFSFAPGIK